MDLRAGRETRVPERSRAPAATRRRAWEGPARAAFGTGPHLDHPQGPPPGGRTEGTPRGRGIARHPGRGTARSAGGGHAVCAMPVCGTGCGTSAPGRPAGVGGPARMCKPMPPDPPVAECLDPESRNWPAAANMRVATVGSGPPGASGPRGRLRHDTPPIRGPGGTCRSGVPLHGWLRTPAASDAQW